MENRTEHRAENRTEPPRDDRSAIRTAEAAGTGRLSEAGGESAGHIDTVRHPERLPLPASDLPFRVYGTPETLRMQLRTERPAPAEASAEEVFGPCSIAVAPAPEQPGWSQALTDDALFQGFVLLLAAVYALLLYRNPGDVRALFGRISRDTRARKRLVEEPGGSSFSRFLTVMTSIGLLFIGVAAVKYGDPLAPPAWTGALPCGGALVLGVLAAAACAVVAVCQWAVLRLTGALILQQPFLLRLRMLRRSYFALTVLVAAPVLLLLALTPPDRGTIWLLFIAVELTVTTILYLRETLSLFLRKKVSILHWFLYLCIVEMFPISLLWLLATR